MLICLLAVLAMIGSAPLTAAHLTGAWTFEWNPDFGGQHGNTHECQITQKGQTLNIQCDQQQMKGKVQGKTVTFEHTTGLKNEIKATYKVTVGADGSVMAGTWHLSAGPVRGGKFQARKY